MIIAGEPKQGSSQFFTIARRKHVFRVSLEFLDNEWNFRRTRNAVGTQAAGECFHGFFLWNNNGTPKYFSSLEKRTQQLLELGLRDPGNRKKMDFHKYYFLKISLYAKRYQ